MRRAGCRDCAARWSGSAGLCSPAGGLRQVSRRCARAKVSRPQAMPVYPSPYFWLPTQRAWPRKAMMAASPSALPECRAGARSREAQSSAGTGGVFRCANASNGPHRRACAGTPGPSPPGDGGHAPGAAGLRPRAQLRPLRRLRRARRVCRGRACCRTSSGHERSAGAMSVARPEERSCR